MNERIALQVYARLFDRGASSIDIPGTTPSLTDNRTMGQNPVDAEVGTFGGRLSFTPDARNELSLRLDSTRQTYDNSMGQLSRLTGTGEGPENFERGYSRELKLERDQVRVGHVGRFDFGTWETKLTFGSTSTSGNRSFRVWNWRRATSSHRTGASPGTIPTRTAS